MKTKKILLSLLGCFILFQASFAQDDIEILKNHLRDDALISYGFQPRIERYTDFHLTKAGDYLKSLNPNGSWTDVDYHDRDNDWSPLEHLNRLLTMTVNFEKKSSSLFQNKELLEGIEKSLEYWYIINPVCDNWYKNEIAKQFYFNVMGLLLQNKIDKSLHSRIVNDLTAEPRMTGSNRTLVAISTIYRGVLENNPERIIRGVNGVTGQIHVTEKEGIQPDYSFHQHGPFIYNGSYGSNFLRESIWLATIVHGTGFAYKLGQIKDLRDYYLKGTRWMVRGGVIDYNVRGRQVGRSDAFDLGGDNLIQQLEHFIIADPQYKEKYMASKMHIENKTPQEISGNKHFWRSDYTAHHRSAFFTSLKMCSNRTVGIELNMNSENKMGYWLPYGLTYIYRHGNEYKGIFPVWDWARLPGVTNPYIEISAAKKGEAHTQQTSFVGGVSNGNYGVSAMHFSKDKTNAKKAWFWFDNEWVALGAGIQSDHKEPIVTGVNQTLLKGAVFVDGTQFRKKDQTLKNLSWVLHDSVGYVFPGNQTVEIKVDAQSGNLQRIYGLGKDSVYSTEVFSLWFDHGNEPSEESYEYIILPGASPSQLDVYTKNLPVSILSNTAEIQAVSHEKLNITGIVFHQAGAFTVRTDLLVAVDHPVLLLLDLENGFISVSDPTTQLKQVEITLRKNNDTVQTKIVSLPADELGGKSVRVPLSEFN